MRKISGGSAPPPRRRTGGTPCFDSIQRSPQQADIYLAIRYHGRPELQKNPVYPSTKRKSIFDIGLNKDLEEQFNSKELAPWLISIQKAMKSLFTGLFLPFYILFSYIPKWFAIKIYPVLMEMYVKVSEPLKKALEAAYTPIKNCYDKSVLLISAVSKKVADLYLTVKDPIIKQCTAVLELVSKVLVQLWNKVKEPVRNLYKNARNSLMAPLLRMLTRFRSAPKGDDGLPPKMTFKDRCLAPIKGIIARLLDIKNRSLKAILSRLEVVRKAFNKAVSFMAVWGVFLASWSRLFVLFVIKIARSAYLELFRR